MFNPVLANGNYCVQSQRFFARVSGLSQNRKRYYDLLIRSLVHAGIWQKLDALYILAAPTATIALTNLVSSSFGASVSGSPTFSVDHGYTGNGTSDYIDTNFVPSSAAGNYTQNSASLGVYVLTNRTSGAAYALIGTNDGGSPAHDAYIYPWYIDNNTYFSMNDSSSVNTAASVVKGFWLGSRTGATAAALYHNSSSFLSNTNASVSLQTLSVVIAARRDGAAGAASDFSADQIAAAWIGGGFSSTEASIFSMKLNSMMTSLGINVY